MRNCRGVFPRFRNRATVFLDGSGVGGIALSSPHSDNTTFFLSLSVGWFHDWSVFLVIHWLCYSLWLFRLHSEVKLQPLSPVFPLAGSIAKGKTGEKGCIFTTLWDETTAYYDRAKNINQFLWHSQRQRLHSEFCWKNKRRKCLIAQKERSISVRNDNDQKISSKKQENMLVKDLTRRGWMNYNPSIKNE